MILGIDYGTKKIGLALSDKSVKFAFPHSIITSTPGVDVIGKIKKICEEKGVEKIVLGRPVGYKGDATSILNKIERFKIKLEEKIGLPVVYENEVLTTRQAERFLVGQKPRGLTADPRKTAKQLTRRVDASAAAIILQSYLDRE